MSAAGSPPERCHGDQPGQPGHHRRARAVSLQIQASSTNPRRPDLRGDRPADRPVDQRLHRPDLRHPDHRRHLQRHGHREGLHQRHRVRRPSPGRSPTAAAACTPAQLLGNAGFETGTAAPGPPAPVSSTTAPVRPPTAAPGRRGWTATAPRTPTRCRSPSPSRRPAPAPRFTFYLHIDTAETGTTAYDKLTVTAGSTTLASYSNLNAAHRLHPAVRQPGCLRRADRHPEVHRHRGLLASRPPSSSTTRRSTSAERASERSERRLTAQRTRAGAPPARVHSCVRHQPTATSSHCGSPCETNEDWPATSSYGKPYARLLMALSCQNFA